jgi:copper(I)-binding protein
MYGWREVAMIVSMKPVFRAFALAVGVLSASASLGQEFKAGDLTIVHPAVRATPGGAKVGAGYLTIRNSGSSPDRLVSIESPSAASVQVHSMSREGDVVWMTERQEGIAIPAGREVAFASGGDHLMFQGLKAPFKVGQTVSGTLVFERTGRVPVTFVVEPIGGAPAQGHSAH